jgi:hypothetical protein
MYILQTFLWPSRWGSEPLQRWYSTPIISLFSVNRGCSDNVIRFCSLHTLQYRISPSYLMNMYIRGMIKKHQFRRFNSCENSRVIWGFADYSCLEDCYGEKVTTACIYTKGILLCMQQLLEVTWNYGLFDWLFIATWAIFLSAIRKLSPFSSDRTYAYLADLLFLFLFIWGGIHSKPSTWKEKKSLAVALNSIFWHIDDVLSNNDNQFHTYVDSIYPNELEIKDTTECSTSALYLDILLKLDISGKLTTQLYDKWDDFNFSPSSTFLSYVAIFQFHLHMVFISRSWLNVLTKKVEVTGVSTFSFTRSFLQVLWSLQRSSLPIQPFFGPIAVWCVHTNR